MIPHVIAAALKLNRMQAASATCAPIQITADFTDTCPEGIGRDLVRSTAPSNLRSVISFHVQPAPRIKKAPSPHPTKIHKSLKAN